MSATIDHGFLAATVRLANVLARENVALAALDFGGAAAMLADKQDAATSFALMWERLRPLAADGERRELAALAQRLDAASIENRRLLEHGMEVQRRLLQIVARAAPRARNVPAQSYGSRGMASGCACTPVALLLRA